MNVTLSKMNVILFKTYDLKIEEVSDDFIEVLLAIFQNSSQTSLNEYLQSIGGAPDIISDPTYLEICEFSEKLFNLKNKRNLKHE